MVLFLGILRPLHTEQKADAYLTLHTSPEAQPHPLFHQLQGDSTQVREKTPVETFFSCAISCQTMFFFFFVSQTFAPGAALWRNSSC